MFTTLFLLQNLSADPPPTTGRLGPPSFAVQHTNGPAKFDPGKMGPLGMMKQQLNLTDDQAKRLEPILKEHNKRWSAFRQDPSLSRKQRAAKMKKMQLQSDAELKTILTTEQFEKWRKPGRSRLQQTNSPPVQF